VINGWIVHLEKFLGFYDVSLGRNAEFSTEFFQKFNFKINGLQTKINSIARQAFFTHCYSQVLSKSCNSIKNSRIFFSNLSGFESFSLLIVVKL
jgi:hypothetical protein